MRPRLAQAGRRRGIGGKGKDEAVKKRKRPLSDTAANNAKTQRRGGRGRARGMGRSCEEKGRKVTTPGPSGKNFVNIRTQDIPSRQLLKARPSKKSDE
jgi:hypothetical protein